jgi:adenine-specific DNA-methyltransferase
MNKTEIIQKIKQLEGLTNDERAYLVELVNTKKKYGLVWEDKPEDADEQLLTQLPILNEVTERRILAKDLPKTEKQPLTKQATLFDNNIDNPDKVMLSEVEAPNHILIEGDNLHALTTLTFTHEGAIDVIYIDPPYNTGSKEDFFYNDHYVDKEDAFRHSKWLSFMQKRLKLAKVLLKENGVIFCSIGDDEISQLTLLFNEVFTENNKLGVIARVAKTAGDKGSYFAPSKDYIIAFTKNKAILPDFKDGVDESLFKKVETEGSKKGEKYRDDVAFYQSSLDPLRGCTNQRYYVQAPDGSMLLPPGNIFPNEIRDGAKIPPETAEDKVWRWSVDTYIKQKHLLVFKQTKKSPLLNENGNKAQWNIYTKSYLSNRSEKGASPRDFLDEFINRKGADLIKQYDIDFSYSKPYELVQHLIKITNKTNDITVLDFFAGSGTTLHAVISLNQIDNGNRTCIITNNNESKICDEVTYPRCLRIIKPYNNSNGEKMPFYPNNNLRYYKTEFVGREPSLKNKRELTKLATELLCIKEDCYTNVTLELGDFAWHKLFTNGLGRFVYVLFDDLYVEAAVETLKKFMATQNSAIKMKVYVFANGQYAYAEEFEEIAANITLAALPDAIYKAYQNVLPKVNREFIPVLEEETFVELQTNLNL